MHADQVPTTPPDELPVTPQEEAAFRSLASFDPAELDGPTRINVTTLQDAEPVYREVGRPLALPDVQQPAQPAATMLLLTVQLTEGRDGEHSAGHVSTIGVVSREALQPSIKLLAQCEDAFSVLNAPRFIRHRLLAVSTICTLTPEAIELADLVDLQSLVHASASELVRQKREGKS